VTELDIEIICANSPQAKGRVERVNQTLQDRLVKELRLQGISDPARANAYVPEFMADFNRRFGVAPRDPAEAHRPLLAVQSLDRIFTVQTPRTVSKNLTIQHQKVVYQLQVPRSTHAFRGAHVLVLEDAQEQLAIEYQGRALAFTRYQEQSRQANVVSSKQLDAAVEVVKAKPPTKPAANHPWRHTPLSPAKSKPPARRASPGGQPPPAGGG